jgi:signal transduction histidine kinase
MGDMLAKLLARFHKETSMGGERPKEGQLAAFSYFAKITSILDLDQLVKVVVEETPHLLNAAGCSVYLIPELVSEYDGTLLGGDGDVINEEQIQTDYIVLAATSRPNTDKLIGKAFYPQGEGLSGWVFKHGLPLRVKNMHDGQELYAIHSELYWSDRYGGSVDYYDQRDVKPILIVPLIAGGRTIGILKVPAKLDKRPFTQTDGQITTIIAQIIAGVIRQTWSIQEQSQRILRLVEISAKEDPHEVCDSVTESLAEMLSCKCRLYMRTEDGSRVELTVEDGKHIDTEHLATFARGQGLVGWVFRTGKPLLIEDICEYTQAKHLDDSLLEQISDDTNVNEGDRFLKCEQEDLTRRPDHPLPLLAVPIKATDGSVYGVLCAGCNGDKNKCITFFNRNDLQLAQSFASTISVVIENERDRRLGILLTELGYYSDPEKLYNLVFYEIPRLISGSGCRIYTLEKDTKGSFLQPVKPIRQEIPSQNDELMDVLYRVGEGKTGFCALAGDTLVVNHYGTGKVAREVIVTEKRRISSDHPKDLVEDLLDENGERVGIIQLRRGSETTLEAQREFKRLAKRLVIRLGAGLPSPKQDQYAKFHFGPSWSFVAVPVKSESGESYGVITMRRPVDRFPFSMDDVTLLETIGRRLATVIHVLTMQEQREQLLMTLAHEINLPLTGILADTENLMFELPVDSELTALSKHNLEQVLRLHLLTETIMAVLSGQIQSREFSIHSIYRPLKEAIGLYESEARERGCDIRPPRSGAAGFPDIEMSLFDLTLAFKNIVHNAVKYSFRPPLGQLKNRYVQITGRWANGEHSRYSVSIQNYGVGITEEEIEKRLIFDPNYRGEKASDRRRTGAGFGLAHARQVIEDLHHGSIKVISKPLPGAADPHLTTVTVTLPVRQPRTDNDAMTNVEKDKE